MGFDKLLIKKRTSACETQVLRFQSVNYFTSKATEPLSSFSHFFSQTSSPHLRVKKNEYPQL